MFVVVSKGLSLALCCGLQGVVLRGGFILWFVVLMLVMRGGGFILWFEGGGPGAAATKQL